MITRLYDLPLWVQIGFAVTTITLVCACFTSARLTKGGWELKFGLSVLTALEAMAIILITISQRPQPVDAAWYVGFAALLLIAGIVSMVWPLVISARE